MIGLRLFLFNDTYLVSLLLAMSSPNDQPKVTTVTPALGVTLDVPIGHLKHPHRSFVRSLIPQNTWCVALARSAPDTHHVIDKSVHPLHVACTSCTKSRGKSTPGQPIYGGPRSNTCMDWIVANGSHVHKPPTDCQGTADECMTCRTP